MNKPYEHEARLIELLDRQTQLNYALDLDKSEQQIAPNEQCDSSEAPELCKSFAARVVAERVAEALRR